VKLLTLLFTLFYSSWAAAEEQLLLAVAANFTGTAKHLATAFVHEHEHVDVKISTASSGKLFALISSGAPYHVFMSADFEKPEALVDLALADESSATIYALGRLAYWQPGAEALTLDALARLTTVALANPKHAPYGIATQEVLVQLQNVDGRQRAKPIIGENVSQAFQFTASGHVQGGFVALSHLLQRGVDTNEYIVIPTSYHSPIQQMAIVTRIGMESSISYAWMNFLRTPMAQHIIKQQGFAVPDMD